MLTCIMGVSGQMLLNEMMDEESSSKEKIENDIEIQKNQLYLLTDQLGLDPYKKKSTDPSRILNRGGNLLKDESECSKIQKQLLELGEELKKKIENWEKEHNSDFLIRTQRFLDSMAHQLQQYKLKKDQPKTSVKWDESATPKGAMKRSAHVNTATPNKIRKVASNLTVLKASSCSNIATSCSTPSKLSLQTKKEFTIKSSIHNRILNSTLKENLDE